MNKEIGIILMFLASAIAAFSQVLLKKSANKKYKNILFEYLNPYVIGAYIIFFGTNIMNVIAYSTVPYKFGPIIGTSNYVFIIIFSNLFFGEKITRRKIIGNILIIFGIIIFSI